MVRPSLDDLYRDKVILDHCRNPRNSGELKCPDLKADAVNPFCGDEIHFQLLIDSHNLVRSVGVQEEGCAINRASGSLFSEAIIGKTISEVSDFSRAFSRIMESHDSHGSEYVRQFGDISVLFRVREFPIRIKCALLASSALITNLR
jgi:nitrogen fixation NifU-like protein